MARRKPFKGFKDLTVLDLDDVLDPSTWTVDGRRTPMAQRLLNRADEAIKRLMLSELPPGQREALEINIHRAVSVCNRISKSPPDSEKGFEKQS
jgi:hypothetical protein